MQNSFVLLKYLSAHHGLLFPPSYLPGEEPIPTSGDVWNTTSSERQRAFPRKFTSHEMSSDSQALPGGTLLPAMGYQTAGLVVKEQWAQPALQPLGTRTPT